MRNALRLLLAIGCLGFPLGCASLIVRDTDSPGAKTAKIATRVTLGIATLTLSEFYPMVWAKQHDQKRQFYAYLDQSVGRLTFDQAVVQWGKAETEHPGDTLFVAQWSNVSSPHILVPEGKDGKRWTARPVDNGWKLRLSFDKKENLLSTWQYSEW